MTDHYDRSRDDVVFRRDVAKSMDVGFELPETLAPRTAKPKKPVEAVSVSGVIGRQAEMVPNAAMLNH
jgi:hypothetical protein